MTRSDSTRHDPLLVKWLWRIVGRWAFRLTFHNWNPLRRAILRVFGATLSRTSKLRRSVLIDRPWNLRVGELSVIGDHADLRAHAPITIGSRSVISQYALLYTGIRIPDGRGATLKIAPIIIGDDCWIATDTLVLPGIVVDDGTVVGARSVVDRNLPAWQVATGDPALPRRPRTFINPEPDADTVKDTIQPEADPP